MIEKLVTIRRNDQVGALKGERYLEVKRSVQSLLGENQRGDNADEMHLNVVNDETVEIDMHGSD